MRRNNNCRMQHILPIDIIATEILPRLPPTDLLRLKCLNKFFYGLISSKEFINDHLRQSQSLDTNGLLIYYTPSRAGVQGIYSLDLDTPNSSAHYIPLPKPFSDYCDIVGSCNGLICLRAHPSYNNAVSFILVNPSTRIVKPISAWRPKPQSRTIHFGFGYDRISDDYKVVVVCYNRKNFLDNHEVLSSVSVCSMKTNSWKYVKDVPLSRLMTKYTRRHGIMSPNGVLTDNNLLHWVRRSSNENTFVISCFDLESETWVDDVPFPDFDDIYEHTGTTRYVNLGVFDGSLCMFTTREGLSHTKLWVMKEYGVKESWVKFVATPSVEYAPLFANGKNELLLTKVRPHESGVKTYVWYNVRDQTTRKLEFSGASSYLRFLTLSHKTLVDIHGGRQIKKRNATNSQSRTKHIE